MNNKNRRINRLLSRLAAVLLLAAMALFTGCPNKITVKPETFAVTFSAGEHGTLKAKADSVTETDKSPISVEKDKTVVFTAVPEKGYEVEKWTVNGTAVANNVSTTYSHKVTAAVTVKVSFKALPPPAVAVTGVTLDQATVTLVEQETVTLKATVKPEKATNKAVTWSSNKPDVAAVDKDGKVTAHKAGEAVVTVKTEDGDKVASCTVRVLTRYTITYHLNDGTNDSGNPANYTVETETITLKDASKANYTFAGWYANAGFTGEKVTQIGKGSTGNKELWAKFLENYSITYHLDGGSNHADNPAKYTIETETITLKPAEKADHIFFGWYASADFSGEKVTEIRKGSSGNKELYAKFIEMKMIDIAAVTDGTVGHSDYSSDNAEHTVSLTAYRIGETEVTQELWQAVMGNNPSNFKDAKNPVEQVNWYECIAFCNELTKKVAGLGESECLYYSDAGYTNVYTKEDAGAKKEVYLYTAMNKKGFRLPTEAEWEWAAKGGKEYKWAGTEEADKLKDYAWYSANSNNQTHEVKKQTANGYGLYDMSGNVWEWCWDWYSNSTPTGGQDPTGPAASGGDRVRRGGSWSVNAGNAARAYRGYDDPDGRYDDLGLRLVSRP